MRIKKHSNEVSLQCGNIRIVICNKKKIEKKWKLCHEKKKKNPENENVPDESNKRKK